MRAEERAESVEAALHIARRFEIQCSASASLSGSSRQVRTRPGLSLLTSPAASRTETCFITPASDISNPSARAYGRVAASEPIDHRATRRIREGGEARVEGGTILTHMVQ
jgi:hypothetical protein